MSEERPVPADRDCIYAWCAQENECLYPKDGKCSLIERGPDGVSEMWKRRFLPQATRELCDRILADHRARGLVKK